MQVDEATVRKIARLARIRISDAEAKALEGELSTSREGGEQLEEVDTDGVVSMTSVVLTAPKERVDEGTDGGIADASVENAPERLDHFFTVPKVVE